MIRHLIPAGVVAIAVGTALVYAALLARGVFVPGTLLILLGVVLCAAGGIAMIVRPDTAAGPRAL